MASGIVVRRRSRLLPLAATSVAAALSAACGSTDPQAPGAPSPSLDEDARVQAFLDARYTSKDVWHSFRAKWGDTIDCVDFFAQPGVKALAAAGHPLTEIPKAPPHPRHPGAAAPRPQIDPAEDYRFRGEPDEDGSPRACPTGSVPLVRIDAERIRRAGGLDAFLRTVTSKPPVVAPPNPGSDATDFAHVRGVMNGTAINEGDTVASIFSPAVPTSGDHSLTQSWTTTGSNVSQPGKQCLSDCVQTVEVGSTVDPHLNGDSKPHLFVFATSDGYWNTGCYNGYGEAAYYDTGNPFAHCQPWVQVDMTRTVGMALPASTIGGSTQHEVGLTTWNNGTGWYVYAVVDNDWADDGEALGYYPAGYFSGQMQTSATTFAVGGEVHQASGQWTIPMGSGAQPTAGYTKAAYHHDIDIVDSDYLYYGPGTLEDNAYNSGWTDPYNYSTAPAAGPGWKYGHFYFGGENIVIRLGGLL